MIGENLLNITKLKDSRFKIETNKKTYIYETTDMYNFPTNIQYIPDIIYAGEIKRVSDNGSSFIITTESGENIIKLKINSYNFGLFNLIDKY